MNVNKQVLLALTSATLFVVAPISAQIADPNVAVATTSIHSPKYDLDFTGSSGGFVISKGTPGFPVMLMVGIRPLEAQLPGGNTLRLDPLAFFEMGNFDALGKCTRIFDYPLSPTPYPVTFYAQAISVVTDYTKFCTSELVFVRTDLFKSWQFVNKG